MTAIQPITGTMQAPRRIAIGADPAAQAALATAAALLGWGRLETHAACDPALPTIEHGTPPALVIVDLDGEGDALAMLARLAGVCLAGTRVLAIGSANDVALFRRLIAAGVGDYLLKPLAPRALADAMAQLGGDSRAPALAGRLVAVIGARGGCGATAVATSLAWAIAHGGDDRCVLVDFDLHHGTAAMTMGVDPGPGLIAMLTAPDRLDEALIAASLQPAADRLHVVAGQAAIETDAGIAPDAALALIGALTATAQWVVADVPRHLDAASRQILRIADTVVLVAPPSLEGLRDTGRLLDYLSALRAGAPPIVVINGAGGGDGELSRAVIEDRIGQPVAAWIPALWRAAAAAAARGRPIAACTGGTGPFTQLAMQVTGHKPRRRRWWHR